MLCLWEPFGNGAPAEFAPVARCFATRVLAGMRYLPASACFSLSSPRLSLPLFYFSPSLSYSSLPSFSSPHSISVSSFPPWISLPLDHRPPLLLGTGHGSDMAVCPSPTPHTLVICNTMREALYLPPPKTTTKFVMASGRTRARCCCGARGASSPPLRLRLGSMAGCRMLRPLSHMLGVAWFCNWWS